MNCVEKDIVWLDQANRNRSSTDAVLVSFTRSTHGERLNITLYRPLVEELRWMAGDRIRIGETDTHICLLRINDRFTFNNEVGHSLVDDVKARVFR